MNDNELKELEELKKLRNKACRAWRYDLTRQEALDLLYELKNIAQDSYKPYKPIGEINETENKQS